MNPLVFFGLKLAGGYAKEKTRQAQEKREQAREDLTEKRRQEASLALFKQKTDYDNMQKVKYDIEERERSRTERFSGGKAMGLDDKYARNYASLPDVQRDVVEQAYKDGQDVNSLFSISNKTGVDIGMETPNIRFNYQPKKEFDTLEEKINSNLVTLATHIEAGGTEDDEDYKRTKAIIDRQTDLMNSFVAPNNPYAKSALETIEKNIMSNTIGKAGYGKFDSSSGVFETITNKISGQQFQYLEAYEEFENTFKTKNQQNAGLAVVQNYMQTHATNQQNFVNSQIGKIITNAGSDAAKNNVVEIIIPTDILNDNDAITKYLKESKELMNAKINDVIKIGNSYSLWGGSFDRSYDGNLGGFKFTLGS